MSLSSRLQCHLMSSGIDFELVKHPAAPTMLAAARRANLPAHGVAKSVVVHHEDGYAMAVLPADRKVNLNALQDLMHYRLGLAREEELYDLFFDCAPGAIPPVGSIYGLKTVVDHELDENEWVWFEGGDHRTMVKTSHDGFVRLMGHVEHASFCCPSWH